MTDIVIPLSKLSPTDNLLLRVALRSIAKFGKNVGKIHVLTEAALPWVNTSEVNIIKMGDPITNNKDANLINKVKRAAQCKDVALHFLFWSDDQLLAHLLDLDKAPVVMNCRGLDIMSLAVSKQNHSKWYDRLYHTLDYIKKLTGQHLMWNYDAHTPQPYTKLDANYVFSTVPYMLLPGFCINTIYYGMLRRPYEVTQDQIKTTFLGGNNKTIPDTLKTYVGYDTQCWVQGMNYFFIGMFFDKCKYER